MLATERKLFDVILPPEGRRVASTATSAAQALKYIDGTTVEIPADRHREIVEYVAQLEEHVGVLRSALGVTNSRIMREIQRGSENSALIQQALSGEWKP